MIRLHMLIGVLCVAVAASPADLFAQFGNSAAGADPRTRRAAREQVVASVGPIARDFVETHGDEAVAALFACSKPVAVKLAQFHASGDLGRLPRPRDMLLTVLEESLFVRQDIPIIAFPDGTIIDGERRLRAAQLKGRIKTLDVVITDERMTPTELRVFQITSSVHRASLSGYEMWRACVDLLALNPTFQLKDLAAHLQMEASSITRYLSPSKCVMAWQEALRAGKVGVSDCYEASKLPEAEQPALLALKLSGASRNAIAAIGKKARNAATPAVKVSNIKVALVGGITIIIKGESIDLEQSIESLGIALKEMKKAVADGLDARTAQSVWRDKAKAGL